MNCTSKDAYASIFKWDNHMPERNTDSLKHRTVKTAVCFRSTTTPRQKRSQDKDRAQRINKVFAEKPQKSSLDGSGVWGKMDTWMCMAEWLCWLKLILLIDYTLIKKKKIKFFWGVGENSFLRRDPEQSEANMELELTLPFYQVKLDKSSIGCSTGLRYGLRKLF